MNSFTVVIVTLNDKERLLKCINSIIENDYPKDKYEILVVDGGSKDGTIEALEEMKIRYIIDEGGNISHGRNKGLINAKNDYLLFTDSDCIVPKDWINLMNTRANNFDNTNIIGIGGPNYSPANTTIYEKSISILQKSFFGSGGSPQSYKFAKPQKVISLANCNIMYHKDELLDKKYLYDESFNVGEDLELNYRLKKDGYEFLYDPEIFVFHHHRSSFRSFFKQMYNYGSAIGRVNSKHNSLVRWYSPIPSLFIVGLLILAISSFFLNIIGFFIPLFAILLLSISVYISIKNRSVYGLLTFINLPILIISYGLGYIIRNK